MPESVSHAERARPRIAFGALAMALALAALAAGVAGGLLRAGAALHGLPPSLATEASSAHAALMIGGFLGTLIAVERAVALRLAVAWVAPLASGLAAVALLAGLRGPACGLWIAAAAVFAAMHGVIVRRQPGAPVAIMALGALSWLVGNVAFAAGADPAAVHAWWLAFLVLTVAGERLELARMTRRSAGAAIAFHAVVTALVGSAALTWIAPRAGIFGTGAALLALACWLARFDAAPRTLRMRGLGRYMAIALLAGYAWLAVAGVAWMALAMGAPLRDAALHALGIGFVLGMVLAHGPMILPAILRVRLAFGAQFYLPLALLHGSLALRLAAAWLDPSLRTAGAAGNAASLLLFALTMLGAALAGRRAPARRRAVAPSPHRT
jgi:hypothetical protein